MENTEIVKEKLKGCLEIEHFSDWNCDMRCKVFTEGKFYFCDKCKSFLSGFKIAIKSELEFLERQRKSKLFEKVTAVSLSAPFVLELNDRITDCKNALKLIEDGK